MSIIIEKEFLEQILEALEMAEQLETDGRVDFKKYSLRTDKDIIAKYKVAISSIKEAIVAPVQEPVVWGWAIMHSDGTYAFIRPRIADFYGSIQEREPFTSEDAKQADREWAGLVPHTVVTLYATPLAAPEKSSTLTIDVFFQEGDDPVICHVNGKVTPYALCEIESQICQNPDFENGDGTYRYEVRWVKGQYGDEGQCEIAPYWELTDIGFESIQQRLTVQQKSTDWIPVDKKLINSHDPMLYEKLWIRHKSGEIFTGTYEWQQGWDPDKFVTDGYGTIGVYEATHIMPFVIPNPPKEIKND